MKIMKESLGFFAWVATVITAAGAIDPESNRLGLALLAGTFLLLSAYLKEGAVQKWAKAKVAFTVLISALLLVVYRGEYVTTQVQSVMLYSGACVLILLLINLVVYKRDPEADRVRLTWAEQKRPRHKAYCPNSDLDDRTGPARAAEESFRTFLHEVWSGSPAAASIKTDGGKDGERS